MIGATASIRRYQLHDSEMIGNQRFDLEPISDQLR